MKMLRALLVADIFLIVTGLAWLILDPGLQLTAFHRPVSAGFLGMMVCLFGLYKGMQLYRIYSRINADGKRV